MKPVTILYFPIGILGQGWYLIVSILDLCTLIYFYNSYDALFQVFNPDRFLPDNIAKKDAFAFVPFSAGPRY